MKIKRSPEFFTDTDRVTRARVALSQAGKAVTLDTEDLDAIVAAGISLYWNQAPDGSARVNIPGHGPKAISRLILGAKRGERVRYRDGDKLNLRRTNLALSRDGAGVALDAFLTQQAQARMAREGKAAKAPEVRR